MEADAQSIICLICWVIIHLILLPYECYWCYQLWQQRNELIITKREPVLVIILCFALAIYIFLTMTIEMIQYELIKYSINIEDVAHDCFFQAFLWIASLAAISRYWVLYYRISYNVAVINNKWQSVLDPNIGKTNWYLTNITKWGSFRYLRKWLLMYFIVGSMFTLPLTHIVPNPSPTFVGICWLAFLFFVIIIPLMIGVYISCKLPSFKDDIGIRKEQIFCLSVMLCIVLSFVACSALRIYFNHLSQMINYIWFLHFKLLGTLATMRSTRSILKRFDKILNGRASSSSVSMMTLAHRQTYAELERAHSERDDKDARDTNMKAGRLNKELKNTIKNPLLFDAFMDHLFNEYSAECLLSIVEFTQFKHKIKDEFEDNDDEFNNEETNIDLPPKMVKSNIVFGNGDNYQVIAFNLYKRYIQIEGEWEININYRDRHRYSILFEREAGITDDKTKLYAVFDECIKEMFGLLLASFTRFRGSKQYQMLNKSSIDSQL